MAERPKYQFKSVQLLKDQSLGIGSYGAVCKAKCDDLLCAAKIIHPTLFDPTALRQIAPQREHRLPIRRFEQECEFMSAIRHPNIVQYLGMFRDTDTRLPVLLMELMDDSLTYFLESSTQPIPYHIQINICHDVTLALSFLHSNNIVHRDLSSNNVLLIGNIRAKVTDFGMARLGDINPQATHFTSTMCPGTDVFMPPEAVQNKPVYTEKIDCFSFGVIIIQILTRKFPNPGDRHERVELNHPGLRKRSVLVEIPEIDRRQNHISQVDPNHSLLPIALDCLKDEGSERPSAHQLCERVTDLKGMANYRDSAKTIQKRDTDDSEVIRSLTVCMEEKDYTISSKEKENRQLRQQLQERDQASRQIEERERQLGQVNQQLRQEKDQADRRLEEKERELGQINRQLRQEKDQADRRLEEKERELGQINRQLRQEKDQADRQLEEKERELGQINRQLRQLQLEKDQNAQQKEEKERQLGCVNQQLEANEEVVVQFERRIAELEQQLSQREQQTPTASSRRKEPTSFKLRWREGKWAPCEMYRVYDAVIDGNTVYIKNGESVMICSCNVTSDSWSRLPDSVYSNSSITVINGQLTTVGGGSYPTYFNELFSLTGEGSGRRWTKQCQPRDV